MRAIRPVLLAFAMLLVFNPVADVFGTVCVSIFTEAVSLVVFPVAVVDIAISVNKPTAAVGLITAPISLVDATIGPHLHAAAMALLRIAIPLTGILCSVLQNLCVAVLEAVNTVVVLTLL